MQPMQDQAEIHHKRSMDHMNRLEEKTDEMVALLREIRDQLVQDRKLTSPNNPILEFKNDPSGIADISRAVERSDTPGHRKQTHHPKHFHPTPAGVAERLIQILRIVCDPRFVEQFDQFFTE
jgi:hypothetical protein